MLEQARLFFEAGPMPLLPRCRGCAHVAPDLDSATRLTELNLDDREDEVALLRIALLADPAPS